MPTRTFLLTMSLLVAACDGVITTEPDAAPDVDAALPDVDAPPDAPTCFATPAGLVARWRGEQNTDEETGLHHGSPRGSVGYVAGRHGSAFLLDGVDDLVVADEADVLYPDASFSVEAWVRVQSIAPPYAMVVQKYECGGSDACGPSLYNVYILDNGAPAFEIRVIGGDGARVTATLDPVDDGGWHHLVGVRDVGAAQQLLYVDGALAVSAPLGAAHLGAMGNDDGVPDLLTIGASRSSGVNTFGTAFGGAIDEVALYTDALAPSVIAALFASEVGPCR